MLFALESPVLKIAFPMGTTLRPLGRPVAVEVELSVERKPSSSDEIPPFPSPMMTGHPALLKRTFGSTSWPRGRIKIS